MVKKASDWQRSWLRYEVVEASKQLDLELLVDLVAVRGRLGL